MSTRSVIARQLGDGWEGRYVHSSGYPTWMVNNIRKLVAERFDGDVAAALAEFIDNHNSWSDLGTTCHCHDNGAETAESLEDAAWFIRHDTDDTDCEWAYVLNEVGISVWKYDCYDGPDRKPFQGSFRFIGVVRWDTEPTDDDLTVLECGPDFEWCGHYAWVHFPEAEGTKYDTAVWLGREKPDLNAATHVEKGGVRYRRTGSGHRERKYVLGDGYHYTHRWLDTVESEAGARFDMFTQSHPKQGDHKPARGVKFIFEGLPAVGVNA